MDKIKIADLVRSLMFCGIISGIALVTIILPDSSYSDRENRELQRRPELTGPSFVSGSFQKKYGQYINDQFIFRDAFAGMAADVQVFMGKKDINGVYIGKDGYLIENASGDYDDGQLEDNAAILSDFINYAAAEYGADHVRCMMIPSKAEALPSKLPAYADIRGNGVTGKLAERLNEKDVLIDLTNTMRGHQDEYIYYRTDHHWTTLGAGYAYRALLKSLGMDDNVETGIGSMTERYDDFYGTTYNKAQVNVPADIVYTYKYADDNVTVCMDDGKKYASMYFEEAAVKGFNRYELFFAGNTFKIEVETKAGMGRTLLLIKDSFANCFVPYLTKDYDRIIMIDYRYGRQAIGSILDEYEDISDILVMYNTDKFAANNKLARLSDVRRQADKDTPDPAGSDGDSGNKSGLEEFDINDFLSEELEE